MPHTLLAWWSVQKNNPTKSISRTSKISVEKYCERVSLREREREELEKRERKKERMRKKPKRKTKLAKISPLVLLRFRIYRNHHFLFFHLSRAIDGREKENEGEREREREKQGGVRKAKDLATCPTAAAALTQRERCFIFSLFLSGFVHLFRRREKNCAHSFFFISKDFFSSLCLSVSFLSRL